MSKYRWLPLKEVLKYEPEMERLGVSKVARSPIGFLAMYKKWRALSPRTRAACGLSRGTGS